MSKLPSPVQGAFAYSGIDSFEKLTALSEKELLRLHGVGKKGVEIMKRLLAEDGRSLRESDD
jgi:DNA-directed RNA polymerase alpha subunit